MAMSLDWPREQYSDEGRGRSADKSVAQFGYSVQKNSKAMTGFEDKRARKEKNAKRQIGQRQRIGEVRRTVWRRKRTITKKESGGQEKKRNQEDRKHIKMRKLIIDTG
jgi:hypothetical protein